MPVDTKKLEHEAIELMNKRARQKPALPYKKQVAMLDRIFKELVPYVLEGFIIKPKQNIGEFMLGKSKNYSFSRPMDLHHKFDWTKTRHDPEGKYHLRTWSEEQYYLFWVPSDRKELMSYYLRHSDSFDRKLHQRLVEKGPIFAYSKQYPGLIPEWFNKKFYTCRRKKKTVNTKKYRGA